MRIIGKVRLNNKLKKMSFVKKNLVLISICFILLLFGTIGYSALNQQFNITGDLVLRAVKDIRISDLELISTSNGGYEYYNSRYTVDTITINAGLLNLNSSVTYEGTISNAGNTDMEIVSISNNLNDLTIESTINNLYVEDVIKPGETKKFTITLTRKKAMTTENELVSSLIEISFDEIKTRYLAYKIYGNSVQNGTPTPSNPIQVKSLGENSKNLFNKNDITPDGYFLSTTDGNEAEDKTYRGTGYIPCKLDTDYYAPKRTANAILLYRKDKSYIGSFERTNGDIINISSITYPECAYFRYNFDKSSTDLETYQIEEGTIATEYRPYSYVDIENSSRNLLDYTKFLNRGTDNVGTLIPNGLRVSGNYYLTLLLDKHLPAGEYFLSANSKVIEGKANIKYCLYNGTTQVQQYLEDINKKVVATGEFDRIYLYVTVSSNSSTVEFTNIQLQKGSIATQYEPYVEPITTTIDLTGHEPLRKVGEYADYIDFENSRIVRNIKKVFFTENTVFYTNFIETYGELVYQLPENMHISTTAKDAAISTHFVNVRCGNSLGSTLAINLAKNGYDKKTFSIDEFKAFLKEQYDAGTPAEIYYVLETPIYEPIDLPEIIKIPGYKNYYASSGISASNFTYEYVVK